MNNFQWLNSRDSIVKRCTQEWLIGLSQEEWIHRIDQYLEDLQQWPNHLAPPRVMIVQQDAVELLAGFMACAIAQCPIFLGNPAWKEQERAQAKAIANPHIVWSTPGAEYFESPPANPQELGWIMIPTGGTSGQIKFAIHTWSTLSAAVSGMQVFFFGDNHRPIHSCCVLPLYHVSGLMQFMRSFLTGGNLLVMPFKTFLQGQSDKDELHTFLSPESQDPQRLFLSLVPTQLSRLIQTARTQSPERLIWLRQFKAILLGGAPASSALLSDARQLRLNLAPTYGMTETAAQVMTLQPSRFLEGESPPGQVLPHVRMDLIANSPQTKIGRMQWSGLSVFKGYYPQVDLSHQFLTDDIAERSPDGSLTLKGRASRTIISGGENIYPEEIEAVLMAMTEIEDVCVFGMPDEDWGEIAIAAYVPSDKNLSQEYLRKTVKSSLASYKCPKIWWLCTIIPRNSQGKVKLNKLQDNWRLA